MCRIFRVGGRKCTMQRLGDSLGPVRDEGSFPPSDYIKHLVQMHKEITLRFRRQCFCCIYPPFPEPLFCLVKEKVSFETCASCLCVLPQSHMYLITVTLPFRFQSW